MFIADKLEHMGIQKENHYLLGIMSFQTFPLLIYAYTVIPQDMPAWVKRIVLYEEFHLVFAVWKD